MPSFDDYIFFVDESGDHGMESIDANYPVFVLEFCVYAKETYADRALDPRQPNRAYEILEKKFRRSPRGKIDGWGLKVFP